MTRLGALLEMVPHDVGAVADVGYDHGHLLRDLAYARPHARLIGVDRQADAAARFDRDVRFGDPAVRGRIELRHGDGLRALAPAEVECVVLSGLAERKIWTLLDAAPDVVRGLRRIVFGPVSNFGYLKPRLADAGWRVVDERLTRDGGRYTLASAVEPGEERPYDDTWHFGPLLFERREPLLHGYLVDLRERYRDAITHIERQTDAMQALITSLPVAIDRAAAFAENPPESGNPTRHDGL